eukprot:TRINITY_DN1994_c0_g1_i1.p1 TRINITY_DN1994_c0_g1~~TRINITY_DN1994_c0_g1_i1.p1  ORF type:complete len:385 (+),score=126.47 TRINITY_DN1994_c0_g1_i1:219-1373(+)
MNKSFLSLAFLALFAVASAQFSVELAAGQSTPLTTQQLFGAANALVTGATFTNGNVAANVTFTPTNTLSASLAAAVGDASSFNTAFSIALGFSLTANVSGSGSLSVSFDSTALTFGQISLNQSVLASTPFTTTSASSSSSVVTYIPSVVASGSATASYSLAFQRNYTIGILIASPTVGFTLSKAFQVAYNSTTSVAAKAFVVFSAAADQTVTTSNAFVRFANSFGTGVTVSVAQNFFGRASASGSVYTAPANTNKNTGVQYSINSQSGNYNGSLTFNSNGEGTYTAAEAAAFSWYKAASGNFGATGWTKIASTSSIDANGNLQVVANNVGSFSEWAVASDSTVSTSSSSGSPTSNNNNPSSARSSASSVAVGALAVVAAAALAL